MTTHAPLSDEEKNELAIKHQNIAYYIANRYRFFDTDPEEVQGWAFLGLAKAIAFYDENRDIDFSFVAFSRVKSEIWNHYKKKSQPRSIISLENQIQMRNGGDSMTIADLVGEEDNVVITEKDLYEIINQALFEEPILYKKIVIDYLMSEKSLDDMVSDYELPKSAISRIQGRGRNLIKRFLINNGIILEFATDPIRSMEPKPKQDYRKITAEDYGHVKYLRVNYPHLKSNDIAKIINTSSYMISSLLDYPTTAYLKAVPDDSIKEKAIHYCNDKYPERMPGEVKVFHFEQIENAI